MIFKYPQLPIILTILTKQKRTDVVEIVMRRSVTLHNGSYNIISGRLSMYTLLLQSFEAKTDHDDDRLPKLRSDVGMCARRAKTSRS